jgi:chemotaxis response regulator CheB
VRVLLVGMSNLLSNIITAALADVPEIVVAGKVGDGEDIHSQIRLAGADAVILQSSEPGSADQFMSLLLRSPALTVVAIDASANNGFIHRLRLCSTGLAVLSAGALQSALGSAGTQ